mgnify:CR=1 FL=1
MSPHQGRARSCAGDEALSRTSTPPPARRGSTLPLAHGISTPPPVAPPVHAPQTESPTSPKRRRLRQKTTPKATASLPEVWDLVDKQWRISDKIKSTESRMKAYAGSHFIQVVNKHMEISGAKYCDKKSFSVKLFIQWVTPNLQNHSCVGSGGE